MRKYYKNRACSDTGKRSFVILLLLLFGFIGIGYGQDTNALHIKDIQMIARPLKDSILLRWAPTSYAVWQQANKFGYKVIRYTIIRDSVLLQNLELVVLEENLGIYSEDKWKNIVEKDKYSAIAAQAIFGKTFELDAGEGFNPNQIRSKAMEQQQRFAFALYAADMSPTAAQAMGLWYSDTDVKMNERYLYRVMVNVPDTVKTKLDTAFVFTGQLDYQALPQPFECKADFGDRLVTLSWNAFVHNTIYTGYFIERSADKGKTFQAVNDDPIAFMYSENAVNPEYMYRLDSLPSNDKEYAYRIRGVTSFGEIGPWSQLISGKGTEMMKEFPVITSYDTEKQKTILHWEFPLEAEQKIDGFKILRSDNHKTGFVVLSDKVKPGQREFVDKKPIITAYYMVAAWKDTLYTKHSYPFLVQLTDSLPPAAPKGLKGIVDTNFVATLNWEPNKDEDIYGYRVFRSVSGKDEYTQMTHAPILDNFFTDTLNKQDLNARIFYKILAVDLRQNESDFSDIIAIEKPDLIPPSAPVFKLVKAQENGISLSWINSSSDDVVYYIIWRKELNDTAWTQVEKIEAKKKVVESSFTDVEAQPGVSVLYQVSAYDKAGNTSSDESIKIQALKSILQSGVEKISTTVDYENGMVTLSWDDLENVKWYRIYRKENEGKYSLYETVNGDVNNYTDDFLKAGNSYFYSIKVIYNDGAVSGFSKEVEVKF